MAFFLNNEIYQSCSYHKSRLLNEVHIIEQGKMKSLIHLVELPLGMYLVCIKCIVYKVILRIN